MGFLQIANMYKKSYFLRFGLPFLGLMIGTSFLLRDVQRVKYDEKQKRKNTKDLELLGIKTDINLEEEYERVQEANKNHEWVNIRGPRPYEDNTEFLQNKELQEKRFEEYLMRGERAFFKS